MNRSAPLPPCVEQELILLCVRPSCDDRAVERIRAIAGGPLSWSSVGEQARRWRVTLLLHRRLLAVCPELIPPELRAGLDGYSLQAVQRNLQMLGGLVEICRAFAAEGLPAAPFKGPLLASDVYGSLATREAGDLDILINKCDMSRAVRVLSERDFTSDSHPDYAAQLIRSRDQLVVELHWQAVGFSEGWQTVSNHFAVPIDLPYVQPRLREVSVGGTRIQSLGPEDLLQVLCLHGSKHQWEQLIWVCDVAYLLHANPQLNWEQTLAETGRLGGKRMLGLGLLLAHELLAAPVPEAVLERLCGDREIERLVATTRRRLFGVGPEAQTMWSELSFFCRLWERPQDRLRFAGHYTYCYARALVAGDGRRAPPRLF